MRISEILVVLLITTMSVTLERRTVSALPMPHIIDAPRAHIGSDIPAVISGKAQALLDEEGLLGTYDLAKMITDEHDLETAHSNFLAVLQESHIETPKKKRKHHRRHKKQRN